jgi:formylglycine-generating enzyme required for sulfatase activity
VNAALVPGRAGITVDSIPSGADVSVDGTVRGKTPLQFTLDAGTYQMEVSAPHYKRWASRLEVKEGERLVLDAITLLPADGMIKLQTKPPGANVTVDKAFAGRTPAAIPLPPDAEHTLHISKAGYATTEQKVRVASEEVRELSLELQPITGTVYFKVIPEDAALFINNTAHGPVPGSLTLNAVPQQIRISKEGYESYRTEITPQPGVPREITVSLQKTAVRTAGAATMIKAGNGYPLILVRPASFTMGSSRQEQGRRSNETIREVTFKRPFYMGLKEVTNGEFRWFLSGHDSGSLQEYSLNKDDQPAVNITWEQAARFCNWLSGMERLPPAYVEQGGRLLSPSPLTSGYRLPTEAEWEFCARFTPDRGAVLIYPWGNAFPPANKVVNIADVSARNLLPGFFDTYEDGYPVSAPPGSFAAGALGISDLAGNVAEWCHDYYSIYSYAPGQRYQDPAGATEGKHHLIRGSSWKHASISALRSAFRDYSSDKRSDVGFRVCRYGD